MVANLPSPDSAFNPNSQRLDQSSDQSSVELNPLSQNSNLQSPKKRDRFKLPKHLNLRGKAILAAISIGTLSAALVGGTAYWVAENTIGKQVVENRTATSNSMADKINRFMFERYGDVQVLSNLPILTNSRVRNRHYRK